MSHEPKGNQCKCQQGKEKREMVKLSMKRVNDVQKVSNQKCVNMQEMDKRCKADLEGGDGIQNKAMRKWNE